MISHGATIRVWKIVERLNPDLYSPRKATKPTRLLTAIYGYGLDAVIGRLRRNTDKSFQIARTQMTTTAVGAPRTQVEARAWSDEAGLPTTKRGRDG